MADSTMLVVTTVAVTVGVTEGAAIITKKAPPFSPLIGGFALGTFLMILNLMSAEIAQGFCILIMLTAVLVNGAPLFTLASKL